VFSKVHKLANVLSLNLVALPYHLTCSEVVPDVP